MIPIVYMICVGFLVAKFSEKNIFGPKFLGLGLNQYIFWAERTKN